MHERLYSSIESFSLLKYPRKCEPYLHTARCVNAVQFKSSQVDIKSSQVKERKGKERKGKEGKGKERRGEKRKDESVCPRIDN